MTRDPELLEAIISARPAGYFDAPGVRGLLERYVDLLAANHAASQRLRRIKIGSPRALPVLTEMGRLTEEIGEIAEWLHLCPGDRQIGFPPPKLQ